MHPVERRGLGCADIGAHVLDRVVPERNELAVVREPRLDGRHPSRRRGARSEMLEPVLGPAHGHAERARREPEEHDVREDGGLDPERAARVGRREEPEPVAAKAERRGGDTVERERPLEVRPGGQPAARLVPVADDAEALDRHAREPRDAERLAHDEIGPCERLVDVAVVERAVVDRRRLEGVEHRIERLVVDGDELGRVLGDVPVARDDDGEGLAHVPRRSRGRRVVRDGRLDSRAGTASRGGRRPLRSGRRARRRPPARGSGRRPPSRARAASGRSPRARRAEPARGRR